MFGWFHGKRDNTASKSLSSEPLARPSRVVTTPGRRVSRPEPASHSSFSDAVLEHGKTVLLGEVDGVVQGMPLLSGAARKTYEASLDPDTSIDEIESLLEHDASLTANLLKLANSAHYGGAQPTLTIHGAMSRVGFRGLREMLMVVAAGRVLRIPGHPEVTDHLLARAPAVAYTSRRVAETLGVNGEACFTAGLLHDIGLPVAYLTAARSRAQLPPEIADGGPDALLELARHAHQAVGQRVGHRWNLAPATVCAIGNHHDPAQGPSKGRKAAWVVAVAMALVDSVGFHPEESVTDVLSHPVIQRVRLTPIQVGRLTGRLREELEQHASAA